MKLKLMAGAAVVAFLAASGAARAQDSGWYAAVDLGYDAPGRLESSTNAVIDQNQVVDVDTVGSATVALSQTKLLNYRFLSDKSWLGFARLGYRVDPHWRVELEIGGHQNDMKSVGGTGTSNTAIGNAGGFNPVSAATTPPAGCLTCISLVQGGGTTGVAGTGVATGTLVAPSAAAQVYGFDLSHLNNVAGGSQTYTAMVNVIYDIVPDMVIHPFIGVGLGMGYMQMNVTGAFPRTVSTVAGQPSLVNVDTLTINDRTAAVAAQAIFGVSWKATDRLNLDLTYRWNVLDRLRVTSKTTGSVYGNFFYNTNGSGPGTVGPFVGRHLMNQSAAIGLRYALH